MSLRALSTTVAVGFVEAEDSVACGVVPLSVGGTVGVSADLFSPVLVEVGVVVPFVSGCPDEDAGAEGGEVVESVVVFASTSMDDLLEKKKRAGADGGREDVNEKEKENKGGRETEFNFF